LRRGAQPATQQLAAAGLALRWFAIGGGGVYLLDVVRDQRVLIVSDGRGVLPEVASTEDSAWQLIELLVFNGPQESRADLGALDDLVERNTRPLSKSGESITLAPK
jgi:hypothetical protein